MVARLNTFMWFSFFLIVGPSLGHAQADNVVFTQCFNAELAKLENVKAACGVMGNQAAGASANPGVQSPDPGQGQGVAQECLRNAEAHLRKNAQKKCTDRAREQMARNLNEPNQEEEPVAAGAQTSACVPSATRTCSPQNAAPAAKAQPKDTGSAPRGQRQKSENKNSAPSQVDRNNRQAVVSAQNLAVQSPVAAGSDANADVALCESSYLSANKCCRTPNACVSELSQQDQANYAQLASLTNQQVPQSSQGLTDYCQKMQSLGGAGGGVNSSLAGLCNSKHTSCSLVCTELSNKYLNLLNSCKGCESQSIYESAYTALNARTSNCQGLAGQVSQISSQSIGSASSAGYGNLCNNVAGANPNTPSLPTPNVSADGSANPNQYPSQNPNDPYNCAADPSSVGCQACAQNPNSAACRALNSKEPTGSAQFAADEGTSKKSKKGDFDLPGLDQVVTERVLNTEGLQGAVGKVQTVANNTGGGIPGAGSGASPASLGGRNTAGQGSPGSPGYTTDILLGTQGAGGYSSPVDPNSGGSGDGYGGRGYRGGVGHLGSNEDGGSFLGVDLRQFLPGGSRYLGMHLAGLGSRSQINAKEEDIWRRISSKMEEKCKLGVLLGCR